MGWGRNWTKEEDDFLCDNWGNMTKQNLCRQLNRSMNSLNVRVQRLGLGRFLNNGDYVTYSQLLTALFGIDDASKAYRINKRFAELPVRLRRIQKKRYKVICLEEFWEWAEQNRRLIDFSKLEENLLGEEPDWVKQKRRIDFICRINNGPWTPAEDNKLKRLLKAYRYTYTDLASEFNRSEGAVKRRIFDLQLAERPLRNENHTWTEEETQTLYFMYEEGWSFEKIGQKLGRSALCCRGKMERIQNPQYCLRTYRNRNAATY